MGRATITSDRRKQQVATDWAARVCGGSHTRATHQRWGGPTRGQAGASTHPPAMYVPAVLGRFVPCCAGAAARQACRWPGGSLARPAKTHMARHPPLLHVCTRPWRGPSHTSVGDTCTPAARPLPYLELLVLRQQVVGRLVPHVGAHGGVHHRLLGRRVLHHLLVASRQRWVGDAAGGSAFLQGSGPGHRCGAHTAGARSLAALWTPNN